MLQGMLQEQQRHCETELRNLVSHHLVLYDIGTVLPRNRPQLLAARVPSFSKAVSGDPNDYAPGTSSI